MICTLAACISFSRRTFSLNNLNLRRHNAIFAIAWNAMVALLIFKNLLSFFFMNLTMMTSSYSSRNSTGLEDKESTFKNSATQYYLSAESMLNL